MDNPDDQKKFRIPSLKRKPSDLKEEQPHSSKRMMPSDDECQPISNLDDLDSVIQNLPNWVAKVERLTPRAATVVRNTIGDCHTAIDKYLIRNRLDARTVPRTLVCHDYKGGYQLDKYVQCSSECTPGNGYPFYYWAQIDIFVYFSHHLITIPPLCWINAGHKNGVKVLGTIITENNPGADLCDTKIFESQETMRKFANSVAELTKKVGFDGWLLKIDNKVGRIDTLKEFVVHLAHLIHSDNPVNLLIWYDSVTENGEFQCQNELNLHNRYFFDSCDGILLNFYWNDINLKHTMKAAMHRNFDVFVGIDVFGKNMMGGGKFHTYKAAEIVRRHNLSIALFAPSWTHETVESTENFFEEFLNRDTAFWCSLWMYLYTHPICSYFNTDFYIGLDKKCYNIFNQQPQLSKCSHPNKKNVITGHESVTTLKNLCHCIQAVPLHSRSSCLIVREHLPGHSEFIHYLFACDMEIVDNTMVYFLTRNVDLKPTTLTITILTCHVNNSFREIKLLGYMKDNPLDNQSILEVNPSEEKHVYESLKNKYSKMIEEHKWVLSIYIFKTSLCKVMEVGGLVERGNSIYLGAFGIQNADSFIKPA